MDFDMFISCLRAQLVVYDDYYDPTSPLATATNRGAANALRAVIMATEASVRYQDDKESADD